MRISADAHVSEPTDLFTRNLPARDHYRAPLYLRLDSDRKMWVANGIPIAETPDYRRRQANGEYERIEPDQPDALMADLKADGVDGALLHPNVSQHIFDFDDAAFALRCAEIYNDYVAETFIRYQPERLFPMAIIPLNETRGSIREIERVAAQGFKGIELPIFAPPSGPYFSHQYDPIWEVIQERRLLVCMHAGSGSRRIDPTSLQAVSFIASSIAAQFPVDHPDHQAALTAGKTLIGGFGGYGDTCLKTIPEIVGGGVLERFPGLHFVMVETGARWLLNLMDTMDEAWHKNLGGGEINRVFFSGNGSRRQQLLPDELGLEWPFLLTPSDYVRRQVHVTFQDDWVALRNRQFTGIEPLIWGNDYPHYEGCWPESRSTIEKQCTRAHITSSESDAIFGGTIERLLGLARN
jgi:predicted TIM-barrel fold metal-dependent hydrolase